MAKYQTISLLVSTWQTIQFNSALNEYRKQAVLYAINIPTTIGWFVDITDKSKMYWTILSAILENDMPHVGSYMLIYGKKKNSTLPYCAMALLVLLPGMLSFYSYVEQHFAFAISHFMYITILWIDESIFTYVFMSIYTG